MTVRPVALTIAGSDSGGGAGIQADLRTFAALGCFGTTAITALTAQNLEGVSDVEGVSAELVAAQARAVGAGFDVRATKTGMLWSAETVARVAELAPELGPLVVDPVMVATSGARLLQEDAVDAYRDSLLPRATVATPNLDEAAILLGTDAIDDLDATARALADRLRCSVLLKGGHLEGDPIDVLCHQGQITRWQHRRVLDVNTHGSGCMLSSAVAARLAHGDDLVGACAHALEFVHTSFERPVVLAGGIQLAGIERGPA